MSVEQQIKAALKEVEDPEVPLSIVEMGLIDSIKVINDSHVEIELSPCFSSCPGRDFILKQVKRRINELGFTVDVKWHAIPTWSVRRITPEARAKLHVFGVGVKDPDYTYVTCPNCGSSNTEKQKDFGSSVSRALYYCNDCRNPFEALRGDW